MLCTNFKKIIEIKLIPEYFQTFVKILFFSFFHFGIMFFRLTFTPKL